MNIIQAPSPNFNDRADGKNICHLILHYTDLPSGADAVAWMRNPERKVSSHYMVDLDGSTTQLVDEDKRAWHAGQSFWEGETDINSTSIGIEIQNTGHSLGYVPFPDIQIDAVMDLCLGIIARHNIQPRHVLAHSDIAPARKIDPGHLFPWQQLAQNNIGLWPHTDRAPTEEHDILPALAQFGYDTSLPTQQLISAFQRHFEPEVFELEDTSGHISPRTLARLSGLISALK